MDIPNTGVSYGTTWGSAVWNYENYIYIMGAKGSGSVLSRIPEAAVASGQWDFMEYWAYHDLETLVPSWIQAGVQNGGADLNLTTLVGLPGVSEASMDFHPQMQVWYTMQISMVRNSVELYTATNFTGPWSMQDIYSIPQPWNNQPVNRNFVTYAPKSHPELAKENEIVFTYNVNTWGGNWRQYTAEFDQFYIPQFIRTTILS